jgi:hypothetical protein
MGETVNSEESKTLIAQVADEVAIFCRSLKNAEAIPGSTEVLESLIGKGKRLLHHSNNSVTQHILSSAAATTEITTSLVQQALSTCRMRHLRKWAQDNLPGGLQVARREDLVAGESNLRKLQMPAIPNG